MIEMIDKKTKTINKIIFFLANSKIPL